MEFEFVYLLIFGFDWENNLIFLLKEDAINASIKYPHCRVEIFCKNDFGYKPTYNYYKNGEFVQNM